MPQVNQNLTDGENRPTIKPMPAVSRRALILAFTLLLPNVFFLVKGIYLWGGVVSGPLFNSTVTLILILSLWNRWIRRFRPTWAFRTGEMLVIYALLGVSTGLVGGIWSVGGSLPAVMTYPFWFATRENGWKDLFWPYLPTWLTVRDRAILEGFWVGEANPYTLTVIKIWLGPALWWATFMTAFFWVCFCINSIIRRRWMDEEKLPFPFVTVPLLIADERHGLLSNKGWWIALGISFGLGAWNAIAGLMPSIPAIPMSYDFSRDIANRWPWSVMLFRFSGITWQPASFGLAYLVPLDILFSLWVFGLLWLAEEVLSNVLGWYAGGGFPFVDYQITGGYVGLALAILWLDRRYLLNVVKTAFGLRTVLREPSEEMLSYRSALLGVILGVVYCWWFWARVGIPGWILASFLALAFGMALMVTRVRAQVGAPLLEVWAVPDTVLRTAFGSLALGPRVIGMLTLTTPYVIGNQDSTPAPLQLEVLKMAEGGRMERRRIGVAMALIVFPTILLSFWSYLHYGYHLGVGSAKVSSWLTFVARFVIDMNDSALRQPTETNSSATLAMGFGFVVTQILLFLKLHFAWWPLHPIAYPICNNYVMHLYKPALIGIWLFKSLLLRYGGLKAHRAALPIFLGILAGDSVAAFLRVVALMIFTPSR